VPTTLLYLVRHGEAGPTPDADRADAGLADHTGGPADRRGPGDHANHGLTARGRDQAELLGARLAAVHARAGIDVIRHSPLRRAAQTAQLLSAHLPGVPVEVSEHLRDRTPILTGDEAAPIPPQYLPFLAAVPDPERDPGAVRLREAVAALARPGAGDRAEVLVTHAFVLGWLIRHALDAPPWRWIGLNPSNCGLTVIEVADRREPRLVRYDDVGHLECGHLG